MDIVATCRHQETGHILSGRSSMVSTIPLRRGVLQGAASLVLMGLRGQWKLLPQTISNASCALFMALLCGYQQMAPSRLYEFLKRIALLNYHCQINQCDGILPLQDLLKIHA
jgi:hypothetical protein